MDKRTVVEARSLRVGIARCEDYSPDNVQTALFAAIEKAGGLPAPISDELLFKVNLLAPRPPQDAVTTHPEVVRAAVHRMRQLSPVCRITVADNPGYVFSPAFERLLEITGMTSLLQEKGVELALLSDLGVGTKEGYRGHVLAEPRVALRYLKAPYVLNIAKLKTHVETEMTGCLKNIFGIADTQTRKQAHCSRSKWDLMDSILDLFLVRPPEFHLLDAVMGMEGNGPSHGSPRKAGWILAGESAVAMDYVAARIMGYKNPLKIPLLEVAARRLQVELSENSIQLVGAQWEELPVEGFRRSSGGLRLLPTFLRGLAHRLVSMKPRLTPSHCTRCRICAQVCPVDAIQMQGYPVIDRRACVACLCCHEMCPTGAMGVAQNWLAERLSK